MGRERRKETDLTSLQLKEMLPSYLKKIQDQGGEISPLTIQQAWPEIIGERLAKMTKAISFYEGILTVKVSNSTLYSILAQHEKEKLLKALRARFPSVEIKNIMFRIG